ncbi:MAG TPA: hypothetical protein VI612_03425 [Candidatus Nanoarchaeia archaeon]|nr:hypothetical protein [Candidatus Nanoarchaeia archaeon]
MTNLLYVCHSNFARGPVAERVTREKVNNRLAVHSAGLETSETRFSDELRTILENSGFNPDKHLKRVTSDLLSEQDIVLCMEKSQVEAVRHMGGKKVFTLPEFAGVAGDIPDPVKLIGAVPDFPLLCTLQYEARRVYYRLLGRVDYRDGLAVESVYRSLNHLIEKCVDLSIKRLEKEGAIKPSE